MKDAERRPQRWVIDRIAPDFRLLDVWALPVEGDRDDFTLFLDTMGSFDPAKDGPALSRALFWIRFRLGALFGWDDVRKQRPIPGCAEASLRDRLNDDLRVSVNAPFISDSMRRSGGGFTPLYLLADECAAEISNGTVHGVLHLAWVEQTSGRFRAQMGVYVKPRGMLGEIYMKAIQPFRHLIVYPAMMRHIGRAWDARRAGVRSA
jgi:hypothetical protein